MSEHNLQAQIRTETGTSAMRRARRLDDLVPAIVYGGKGESTQINLSHKTVLHGLQDEAFYSSILTLNIDGKSEQVVLKAIQRHPYKQRILHMDFFRVSATEKLVMTVPLHYLGEEEAPGAKEGGVISHQVTEVEIRCLPKDLPEFIEVDISGLGMNGIMHLSQIKMPANVELLAQAIINEDPTHDHAIVSIHPARAEAEPEEKLEGAEEAAEGETPTEGEEKPEESSENAEG